MRNSLRALFAVLGSSFLVTPALHAQRKLQAGQVAQLRTLARDGTEGRLLYETTTVIEAPNWTPDGKWLVYNSGGRLWRIAADGSGQPQPIASGALNSINNDHMLSPDGQTAYVSAGGHLYALPIAGGEPRRISNEKPAEQQFRHFLHGISPDGRTLAYVGVERSKEEPGGRSDLYLIPAQGGRDTRLTNTPAPDDGPEFTPDGKWIYFNSELNAKVAGHAQVFRMRPDGTGIEQLTHDERVNWFPHISPDGKWMLYISFPPGTLKHPADKEIILRCARPDGTESRDLAAFLGGQGTINVNSWSPDSRHFAYVAYPKSNTVK